MNLNKLPPPSRSIANDSLLTETARLIATGHTVTLTVRGNSMNPFVHDRRDRVVLAPFTAAELRPGDVVLAQCDDGRVVLHRIIARHCDELRLMGDGNPYITERCHAAGVMGKVVTVVRRGKEYPCCGATWCIYSAWWMRLRPLRRYLLWVARRW